MWVTFSIVGSIALGLLIGLWVKQKFNKFMLICAILSGLSLAYPIAEWGGPVLARLNNIAPWVVITVVLASIASVMVFYDFKQKTMSKFDICVAFLAPILFLLAAGPFLVPLNLVGEGVAGLDAALSSVGR